MIYDSEKFLDSIFLSYNKIFTRLQLSGVTTRTGKEMTYADLKKLLI